MTFLKRTPRCPKCGWLGDEVIVDMRECIDRSEAEHEAQVSVLEQVNHHLYNECEMHERWEYVPTYKCDSCRQMVPLRDSNVMPEHADKAGERCPRQGRLPRISVVNGGAQGTGKRR